MSRNRSWIWGVVGAVLAVGVTLAVLSRVDEKDPEAVPSGGPTKVTLSPTDSGSSSPSPSETASPTTFTVAAYFIGDTTARGPQLFREFSRSEGVDVGTAALSAALSNPTDDDYDSPWSTLRVTPLSVELDGGTLTVDLGVGDAASLRGRPVGLDADVAGLAVEQLVRTAQGALKAGRVPVQFLVNGDHVDTLFGVPVSEPVSAADDSEVLSHVWVNSPLDGASVSGGDEVEGLANSFEANVTWQLMQGDTVVEEGFTTAEEAFMMAPFSFELPDVPPGEYTLVVSEDDPSGGEGGGPDVDTKVLTFA